MAVSDQITRLGTEISTQADLIKQISAILNKKSTVVYSGVAPDNIPCTLNDISITTLSTYFTPKTFEYYGGYYWIAGNDSSNNAWYAFSTNAVSWTATIVASGRAYPVHALGVSGDNEQLFIFSDTSAYNGRCIVRIPSPLTYNSGSYNYYTNYLYTFTDAISYEGSIWAFTGTNNTLYVSGSAPTTLYQLTCLYNPPKGCMYNTSPVAISSSGQYEYRSSITSSSVTGSGLIDSNITCCDIAQMGDYLCVAATKTNGSYIYYAKGELGALTWNCVKISDSIISPIGMTYANGLGVMAYTENSNLRFWTVDPTKLFEKSVSNIEIENFSGYSMIGLATDGTVIASVLDTGSSLAVSKLTV